MDDTDQAIFKALVLGTDIPASVPGGELDTAFAEVGALTPSHDPETLCRLFEHSNSLRPNVDAYATNIDGFGHRLDPAIDLEAENADERVAESLFLEALAAEEGGEPSPREASPDEIADRVRALERLAQVEKSTLGAFFDSCCYDYSFVELRRRSRQDLEVTGNAYWEVLRNGKGDIARLVHVPSYTMRLMPLDKTPTEMVEQVRISPVTYESTTIRRRLRRFVQIQESTRVYFKELGDPRSIALSLNNIGLVKQDSGVFKEAIVFFQDSLKIRREIGDITGLITSLNNLGTVYVDKGDQETAVNLWREGLDEAKKIDDKLRQTYLLTNIGVALYHMERFNDAVETLEQASKLSGELGDRLLIGETARALGKTHALMGDHQKAREYLDMALDTFTKLRSKVQIGIALRTLAEVILAGGWSEEDERKAEEVYLRSVNTFEDIGNDLELARSLKSYSNLLNKQGRVQEAEKHARRAQAIFTQMKVTTEPVAHEATRISAPGAADPTIPQGGGA